MMPTPYSGSQRHDGPESRQPAAVRDDVAERAGLRNAEPEAVAAGVELDAPDGSRVDRCRPPDATAAASRAATSAGSAPSRGRRAAATPTGRRRRSGSDRAPTSASRPSIRTSRSRAAARPSTARPPSDSRARGGRPARSAGSSVVDGHAERLRGCSPPRSRRTSSSTRWRRCGRGWRSRSWSTRRRCRARSRTECRRAASATRRPRCRRAAGRPTGCLRETLPRATADGGW